MIQLCSTIISSAQYYFYNDKYYNSNLVLEAGIAGGIMNCLTDLGGRPGAGKKFIKDLNWKVCEPAGGLYLSLSYKDAAAVRFEITHGRLRSADSLLRKGEPDLTQRYGRNLSFKTSITECQLALEIHPLFFRRYENDPPRLSPYIIGGIGYFKFNPLANLEGHWYALKPLRLEGQGFPGHSNSKPYQLNQFNIPVGYGMRYELNAVLQIRIEIVYRILFTDYLDDVSRSYIDPSLFPAYLTPAQAAIARRLYNRMRELQPGYVVQDGMLRGSHENNDAYFSMQVKLGWVFRKKI